LSRIAVMEYPVRDWGNPRYMASVIPWGLTAGIQLIFLEGVWKGIKGNLFGTVFIERVKRAGFRGVGLKTGKYKSFIINTRPAVSLQWGT